MPTSAHLQSCRAVVNCQALVMVDIPLMNFTNRVLAGCTADSMAKTRNALANSTWTKTIPVQRRQCCTTQAPSGTKHLLCQQLGVLPSSVLPDVLSWNHRIPRRTVLIEVRSLPCHSLRPITGVWGYEDLAHLLQFEAALKGRAGFRARHGSAMLRPCPWLHSPSAAWLFLLLPWQALMLRNSSINLLHAGFHLRVCSTGNLTYHTVTAWSKGDDS